MNKQSKIRIILAQYIYMGAKASDVERERTRLNTISDLELDEEFDFFCDDEAA